MGSLLLAAVLAPAAGDPPGPHLLIHPSAKTGRPDLFLTDPATGDTKNLTNTPDADEIGPAFRPDGKRVAFLCKTKDHDFEVYACDPDGTNRTAVTKPGPERTACFFPSWSPDGKRIAYTRFRTDGHSELRVVAADGATDVVVRADATGAAWGPDGRIAVVRRDGPKQPLCLIDADGGNERVLIADIGPVQLPAPAWSPDGAVVTCPITTDHGWQLAVVPAAGGEARQLTYLPGLCTNPVWVSPTEVMFAHAIPGSAATAGYGQIKADGTRVAGHPLGKMEPSAPFSRPAVYVPRPAVAAANPIRPVAHTEPQAGPRVKVSPLFIVPPSAPGAAAGVAWSADGSKIAVSLEAGPVAVGEFDGKKFEPKAAFLGHTGAASSVIFTADGKGVFTTGADKTLRTWDIAKNGSTAIESDLPAFGEAVAATADGAWLATGHRDGTVKLRHTGTADEPRVVKVCEPARGGVHALAFGPKGALFAGCARWDVPVLHGAVAAFDPATGKETWRTTTAMGGVYALAVSPDGKKLAGAGLDGQVRVWDAATGKELAAWKGHTDRCTGVAWALGGKAIVTAGFDHTVRVWDAATGANHVTAGAQVGPSVRVAVHPDGTTLCSTCVTGAVVFWKLREE